MSLYGLIIALAFFLSLAFFQKTSKLNSRFHNRLFYGLIISGILGARIYHVLDHYNYYSQNQSEIIKTWHGGLGIYGGLLGSFLFLIYFTRKHRLKLLPLLNDLAAPTALAQAIGRWGNYANLEVFGTPTLFQFGQLVPFHLRPLEFQTFAYFHPVWLYESLGCLLLFYFLTRQSKNRTAYYLFGYGLLRFFLEFFRFDTWQYAGLKVAQILSLLFVLVAIKIYRPQK